MEARQEPRLNGAPDDQHRQGTSLLLATDTELADDLAESIGLVRAAKVARLVLAQAEAAVDLTVPADVAAESAVLGACLVSARCLDAADAEGWSPELNHHPAHRRIVSALFDHYAEVGTIDTRTCLRVADHLRARHLLAEGDVDRITEAMAAASPHPPGVAVDVARLVELADRRHRMAQAEADLADLREPAAW